MAGIELFGAYIPLRRLGQGTQGWRSPNEKAVAFYDEDSMTMAVAAVIDCLGDNNRSIVDGLYAASTTFPYKEKLTATTIAIACDLRKDIITMDCVDSLRSGTGALRMAIDTVKAGSAKKVLVVASDCRLGDPRSELDQTFGDGAVAFLVGNDSASVELEASYSVSNELIDLWRGDTAKTVNSWEDRWVQEEGYLKVFPAAVKEFLSRQGLKPADITKAALYGNNARRHGQAVKMCGFKPEQVQDPLYSTVGNTGTASALMMFASALENAKTGDRILCASYGDGADVMLFKVTGKIVKPKRGIKTHIAAKTIFPSYDSYFAFHHQSRDPESGGGPSASSVARDRETLYALKGSKCRKCGTVQYPPQRVCTVCKAKDEMDEYRFSDKRATIFTRVPDYAAPVPPYDIPHFDILIDFEGGGRANFSLTDKKNRPEDVPIDMEVEMTFRKLLAGGGIHHYWWKAMPVRESWIQKEVK